MGTGVVILSWYTLATPQALAPATSSTPVVATGTVTTSTPETTTKPAPTPISSIPPVISPTGSPFGSAARFTISSRRIYTDGLEVTLKNITDSRCKPDEQCIWAGELAPEFTVTGGKFGKSVYTVTLGTIRNTSTTQDQYRFSITDVSTTDVLLMVTTKPETSAMGTIRGTVSVSPICPVERVDTPCVTPPEVYTSRKIVVYNSSGTSKIQETALQGDGSYSLELNPGDYLLQIVPAGIGAGEKKSVTIKTNTTKTIDFAIDSGIR